MCVYIYIYTQEFHYIIKVNIIVFSFHIIKVCLIIIIWFLRQENKYIFNFNIYYHFLLTHYSITCIRKPSSNINILYTF